MIMIMDNGKMNPLGRLEYGAVMRHRNPLLCTMAHTAFYLFYWWNIAGVTPPCFRQRQQWYGLHLIKGEHAARQMAYDTQLDWINRMFTGAGVTSLKKTHAGPSQGAKHAELKGVHKTFTREHLNLEHIPEAIAPPPISGHNITSTPV